MQDCASLAWSLGKLAYRDPDLMEAICDRYVAACGNAPPESIGIVSQMLKGVLLQRCLTPQLMQLLQAQAEKTLGSAERSAAVLQEVMDGYALLASNRVFLAFRINCTVSSFYFRLKCSQFLCTADLRTNHKFLHA